jgi:hypothetical protein
VREGACTCGAVRYSIDGPVRDVVICHCNACSEATGGPWAATAVARKDLVVAQGAPLSWEHPDVSEHDASRGRCSTCRTVVFWDAPGRETVSLAVSTLSDPSGLEIAARIWVGEGTAGGAPASYPRGLPGSVVVPWRS